MRSDVYRQAEKYLYRYATLKNRELRAAPGEAVADATCIAYGQAASAVKVKSSKVGDPTQAGGIKLAEAFPQRLSDKDFRWIRAIEGAWAELTAYEPHIASLMEMAYGLTGGGLSVKGRQYVRDTIMHELHIKRVMTYYDWRRQAVHTVIYHYVTQMEKSKISAK